MHNNKNVEDTDCIPAEQVSVLMMQAPVSNITAILIALVYFIVLKDDLDSVLLGGWAVLLSLTAFYRLYLWRAYQAIPESADSKIWLNKYTVSTIALGIAWSLIYLLVDIPENLVIGAYLVLFFGVSVAAFSILSIYLRAYFLYTLPSMITFLISLHRFDGQAYIALQLVILIFSIMMALFVINTNRQLKEAIILRYKNKNLVKELTNEVQVRDQLVLEKTQKLESLNTALSKSENQLRHVINSANLGYWDWDYQSGSHEVNDRWLEILGLSRADIKNDVSDWSNYIHPDDQQRVEEVINSYLKNKKSYAVDFRMKHKLGHWVWVQGSGAVVEFSEETGEPMRLCGIHMDISDRKEMENKLEYQATHDSLTGLLNRGEMWKQLDAEIRRAERYHHQTSIFLIDIDHFKSINDRFGHKTGDRVLQKFAEVLSTQVRSTDYALRYGGEEFVVILPETGSDSAVEMAERLRQHVTELKIPSESVTLAISASIGVASFPDQGNSPTSLLDAADKAMYQAKEEGRNLVRRAAHTV